MAKRPWNRGAAKRAFAIIAASVAGARRRDVVAECVAQGINIRTARTHWQVWLDSQKQKPAES